MQLRKKIKIRLSFLPLAASAGIPQLSAANLPAFLARNPRVILTFEAPWCGHCKEFRPALAALRGVTPAIIDATEETELAAKFGVEGYPTIFLVTQGRQPIRYTGKRDAASLMSWIGNLNQPETVEGDPRAAQLASQGREKVAFFGGFPPEDESALAEFRAAAKKLKSAENIFYESREGPLRIEVYRDGKISGVLENQRKINMWIEREQFPLFGEIDSENFDKYEDSSKNGVAVVWVCFDPENHKNQLEIFGPTVEILARRFRSHFNFVWIDSEKVAEDIPAQIGCSSNIFPAFVVHAPALHGLTRYRLLQSKNIDISAVSAFLDRVVAKKEPLFFRSKEAGTLTDGYVPELNADQLLKILSAPAVNSLLLVSMHQSSLCPDCKVAHASLSLLQALAAHLPGWSLNVFWIDGIENDPPSENLSWDNVPNLLFLAAGSEKVMKFGGSDFTLAAIAAWLGQLSGINESKSVDAGFAGIVARYFGNTARADEL